MTSDEYAKALDAAEARMRRQYLERAAKLAALPSLQEIMGMIEAGNTIAAFSRPDNAPLMESVRQTFIDGGRAEAAARGQMFDPYRPSAEANLQRINQSNLVQIAADQGDAVQASLSAGVKRGDTPRKIAKNMLGVDRAGGVAGLTGIDAEWLENARNELLSGDASLLRNYLSRTLRDRRYDGIVNRAIDGGTRISATDVDRITTRYGERLLANRADITSSIMTVEAYAEGRNQLYVQMVEDGTDPNDIFKRWKSRGDERVRMTHRALNGQVKRGDEVFVTARGARMSGPGDRTHGAGLSEIAKCRCRLIYGLRSENPAWLANYKE